MPAEVLYKGPKPLPGERWCFACAYTWKAAVNERFALTIDQAMSAPDGSPTVWIDATGTEDLPPLATAVGVGLFWSHLTAIRLQSTGGLHLPAPGQGVPGMNGMGGLLG